MTSPLKAPAALPSPRRRYPRASVKLKATVSIFGQRDARFSATLTTSDLSVGGLFLESTFFMKLGQEVVVELQLPKNKRTVRAKGRIVRIEQLSKARSGFAVKFTEYLDGSDVVLANYFLAPVLKGFVQEHARRNHIEADEDYVTHVVDVLAAWELRKTGTLDPKLWGNDS